MGGKGIVLFHSATGNTRLVAKRIAGALSTAGIETDVRDTVQNPAVQDLRSFDLVGFGAPTMAWKPSYGFHEYLGLVPSQKKPKPAFVFCTSGGQPINTLRTMTDLVSRKNFVVLDGLQVGAETSWPVARQLGGKALGLVGKPGEPDLAAVGPFAQGLAERLRRGERTPRVFEFRLHPLHFLGLASGRTELRRAMGTKRVNRGKCVQCASCAAACAAHAIALGPYPVFSNRCMGCWACYNVCPTGAITTTVTGGRGRYRGPALKG